MSDLVAVYGTLRSGEGNNRCLDVAGGDYLGSCILPNLTMYSLHEGFPGVVKSEHKDSGVFVEVYHVDDMTPLDCLEGYCEEEPSSGLYNRHLANTPFGEAWVYTYNADPFGDIISDWMEFKASKRGCS